MLTLQNLLESDSLSSIIAKLNNNFQVLSLAGGGPQGIRGEQGIPGLPGRIGATGPIGPIGPTGLSAYMIPFATGNTGTTGPSTIAGPWPLSSYDYLYTSVGTGGTGDIYIDHYNKGYWMFLTSADGTGQYSGVGPSYPPTGTGYFGGDGWYFYPQPESIDLSNVWTYDYSTYFTDPPYATGPFSESNSPLKIPNARFNSKYGTVWISAGNSGITGSQDYDTPSIESWGEDYGDASLPYPQPGRWNAGVDRLLFKFSLDSLPYHSNINARSITLLDQQANLEDLGHPNVGVQPIAGDGFWVKPMYNTPLDSYTPLFFWSELRTQDVSGDHRFGSLGLYQFTAVEAIPYGGGAGVTAGSTAGSIFPNERKSIFLLSTRSAPSPEDYEAMGIAGAEISNARTINLSELVLDVKSLTTSNQVVCALPQDLVLSSDYVNTGDETYREASGQYPFRVFQGFISAANGKNVGGTDVTLANYLDYGAGVAPVGLFSDMPIAGNQTRRSWYGSGFRFDDVSSWDENSSDPLAEGYSRLAGMAERGKRTWNTSTDDTYFLSELIFYASQYKLNGAVAGPDHTASSQDLLALNAQRSLPVFYVSPFRNLGIGTFAQDDSGVWEPLARFHSHINPQVLTDPENDPSNVWTPFGGVPGGVNVNNQVSKVAMFTSSADSGNNGQGFIDIYIGRLLEPAFESANPYASGSRPISGPTGEMHIALRREGWVNTKMDSFRIGVSPATGANIGSQISAYKYEFQLGLHPLNIFADDSGNTKEAITGFGVHNLWPRTRFHKYGKNTYNEADNGETTNDTVYPGFAYAAQGSRYSTYPYYQPNYLSSNQVITDYIGDSYLYPTGVLEYPYTAFSGTPLAGIGTASVGLFSANAANFPSRERLSPTRHIVPYGNTGSNGALYAAYYTPDLMEIVGSTGAFNGAHRHGGTGAASFKPVHYQGFNLFRDLMNKGDDKDVTTTWIAGSNGARENGGSAIITNADGDFAIATIKTGRSGGDSYAYWEQRLSTRDVLNNIKLIIKKDGSVGFGNAAGYDEDAYSSQERNINTGYLNYVPRQSVANGLTAVPSTAGASAGHNITYYTSTGSYGLVNYAGVSGIFVDTASLSSAARINANATSAETFRAEFAADKLHGRPGRTIQNGGWGYPNNGSVIGITGGTDVTKYVVFKDPAVSTYAPVLNLTTDLEGRITSAVIQFGGNPIGAGNTAGFLVADLIQDIMFPHPTEFQTGGPLASSLSFSYETPVGAAAAAWGGGGSWNNIQLRATLNFEADPLILGNIRLNNFVAGEGIGHSGMNSTTTDVQAVKTARQTSPKLVFTFMEADSAKIPGSTSASRPTSATTPYRKVNTVIASAQNESSLREYWIPKADNTGGTFMVFTDHYGRKEKDSGFDSVTIDVNNFLLDEVVALEFIYGYTGITGGNVGRVVTGPASNALNVVGCTSDAGGENSNGFIPAHVLYRNTTMTDKFSQSYGVTGPAATSNYQKLFSSSEYARLYPLGPPPGTTAFSWPDATLNAPTFGGTASTIVRNIDKYYSIYNPATDYDDGWGDPNYNNKASGFRFKRINSEFALVDFNMTIAVRNPNLNNDKAPGEPGDTNVEAWEDLIDRGSPRWTQFIRMKYFPSANDPTNYQRNFFLRELFGNGLGFGNWSSYKNWFSGWAVVGDDDDTGTFGSTETGDSYYMTNAYLTSGAFDSSTIYRFNRWNGNLLNYGMTKNWQMTTSVAFDTGVPKRDVLTVETAIGTVNTFTWLDARKESSYFLYSQSMNLALSVGVGGENRRQAFFQSYLGATFQLMGNRAFSRNRSCAWRIIPQYGNYWRNAPPPSPISGFSANRNSFMLEVMFDDPIMHHDSPMKNSMFREIPNTSDGTGTFYKYLTVSGQSIIRYSNDYNYTWNILEETEDELGGGDGVGPGGLTPSE